MNNGIKTYNYTYDDVNNITSDNNKNYTYDDIYRIKQTTDTNTTTLLESFDYDNLGNRQTSYNQATGSGANYDYTTNSLNQYTTLSGSILSYQLQEIIETTISSGITESGSGTTETGSGTTESGSGTTETGSGTTETGSGTTESGSGTTTGTGEITTTTITYTGSLVTTNENIDYLYDNNGNLKQDNKYKYYYDYKNRLVKATNLVDETIVEFSYDVLNRRFQKTTAEKVINYVYSNENILQETTTDNITNISTTKDYINGLGVDELVAFEENTNRYYYHTNHLGSVTAITDNTGNIVVEYDYDVFGKAKVISGDANFENTRLYTGREYDAELGLYYNRARYYNPELARFISRDPIDIKDDVNLYAYVGNNGVNFVDPMGLKAKDLITNYSGKDYSQLSEKDRFNYMLKFINSDIYKKELELGNSNAIDILWIYSMQISNNDIGISLGNMYNTIQYDSNTFLGESENNFIERLTLIPSGLNGEFTNSYSDTDKLSHFFKSAQISYYTSIDSDMLDTGGFVVEVLGQGHEINDHLVYEIVDLFNIPNSGGYSKEDIEANRMGASFGKYLSKNGSTYPSLFTK